MPCLFDAIGRDRCFPRRYAERIANIVPDPIRRLPCFLDRFTGIWRYEYGEPIALRRTGGTVVGTPMFPEVEQLFDVLGCVEWRLDAGAVATYLNRLTDPRKHEDVLVEFAPILRLSDAVTVQHEVCDGGAGNATVDWRIQGPGQPAFLLEVKNRILDLIKSFEEMSLQGWNDTVPPPDHDHGLLFRSVAQKFKSRRPEDAVQCVWIKAGLLQEEAEFRAAFKALDLSRVHAAVLGDWGEDAYVLATNSETKKNVLKTLRLKHTRRLVFKR